MSKLSRALPALALLFAAILWGSDFIAMKIAVTTFDPLLVGFMRMALASLLFATQAGKLKHVRYQKGDWKFFLGMALFEPVLYFAFEAYALTQTTASQASMVAATLPLMVAMCAALFLKEAIRGKTWAGFILAATGVIWLTMQGSATENAPNPALGNFLEFLAMACATGNMIIIKRLTTRYSPWFLTAVQSVIGTLCFVPVLPFTTFPDAYPLTATLSVLYLGMVVTIFAYGLFNYGMSRMPANQASAFLNLIPVFSVLMAFVLLNEHFTPGEFIAAGIVLTGVIMSQQRKATLKHPPQQTTRET